jgi:hypothetical protein
MGVGAPACALLNGFSNVTKLDGSALFGAVPGGQRATLINVDSGFAGDTSCVPPSSTIIGCITSGGTIHLYQCSAAQLDYDGLPELPPAKVTFLAFGFEPVTAVMTLKEVPWPAGHKPTEASQCYTGFAPGSPIPIASPVINIFSDEADDYEQGTYPQVTTAETYLSASLSQVSVNGTPLDISGHCVTAAPIDVQLTGTGQAFPVPTGYTLADGGPLTGEVTIPRFTGCTTTTGENLDPLFDASVSGPGNYMKITQGGLCAVNTGNGCPPTVPVPER